jgi:photosystem II stability/assembly factor-like uncharacterized protein
MNNIKKISSLIFLFLVLSPVFSQVKITSALFGALTARQIGPAPMSGRITAIDAVNNDPRIMYIGAAGGGVWKTINGGAVFKSVFDKYAQSIGAITIDQKNPDIVWVGTGESNMRNSVCIGDGLYKTDDGGDNWKKVGLDKTQHIAKIIVDPANSNIVYVAAPGPLWGDSEDRGLYKTTDGGTTWEKILYIDEKTGCADIVMDPKNPKVIYAAMWQFRRKPWAFSSGGEGSGLYKSIDGGQSWDRIDQSFSEDGILGRICLAISPSDPKKIYAIAESRNTGLYESNDGGETWKRNSATGNVTARPFYFSVIAVDPTDEKRIYRPAFNLSISDDGGQSFREASFEGGWVHADHHAIWINPKNPQNIYLGTDGGLYVSYDRGNNFIFFNNLPVSQFYHVSYDLKKPFYNVSGGLQDNGSWIGPSNSPGGINNSDWKSVGFGDGFHVVPDWSDENYVYWQWQGGNLARFDNRTNESKDIKPQPVGNDGKLRFNWNTPLHQSVINPGVIYTGSQFLYRSRNKGDTWEKISPDLTTNDPEKQKQEESGGLSVDNSSAENHCTIFSICESPLDANIIWAGTDDGNLQVSENGGVSWTNTVKNIQGVPKNAWVSSVDASRFDKNTAFVTFDNHAMGDMKTYIFRTNDLGKTWTQISTADINGYAHKIKQDLINQDLLFAGTAFGLYISIDGGTSWVQYNANVPNAEIRDIAIHPQTNDLILASHGRGVMIIDDLTPIRNINQDLLNSDAALIPTRQNYVSGGFLGGTFPDQAGTFVGPNSTEDAVIMYYLKDRVVTGDVKVEIYDNTGKLLKSIPGTKRKGINKVTWDMRHQPPKVAKGVRPDNSGFFAPFVPEGSYVIKLVKGDKIIEGTLDLKIHPDMPHSKEDITQQYETSMKLYKMTEDLAFLVENISRVQSETEKMIKADKVSESTGKNLIEKLEELRSTLVATKEGRITGEEQLRERLGWLYMTVTWFNGKPTDSQLERIPGLAAELEAGQKKAADIFNNYLNKVNSELKSKGATEILIMTREEFEKTDKKS